MTEAAGGLARPPTANPSPPSPAESKFTEQARQAILNTLANSGTVKMAAALAGVTSPTVYAWMRRGAEDQQQGIESDYAEFALNVEKAMATPLMKASSRVTRAIENGDVQSARWLLERRLPNEFGRTDKVQVQGDPAAPVVIQLKWPTGGMPDPDAIDAASEEVVDAELVEGD